MKKVPDQTGRGVSKLASPAARELAGRARGLQQADSCDRVTRIDRRAGNVERILATVSRELTAEFGGGFGYATVNCFFLFAQFFPDPAIVSALSTQLSWSHFIELLAIKERQRLADTAICRSHGGQMPLSGVAI